MKDLKAAADTFKETSFAAKGIRKSDIAEVMSTPPEGLKPGLGRNVGTGRLFNAAREFGEKVAKPFMRRAAILGTLGDLAEYSEEQRRGRQSTRREDISGGPGAEISSSGSPIKVIPRIAQDNPDDVARAKFEYDKRFGTKKASTEVDAKPNSTGSKKRSYSHDISDKQKKTIRGQAMADMKRRADAGDTFWAEQLRRAEEE